MPSTSAVVAPWSKGDRRALMRTTTFQLTLSYSLLFGISLSLLTLFFYWSTIGLLVRETDVTLKSEITGLAEQYIEGHSDVGEKNLVEIPLAHDRGYFAHLDAWSIHGNEQD